MSINVKYKYDSQQHNQFIKHKFFGWILKLILFIWECVPLIGKLEEDIYTYNTFNEIPNYDDIIFMECYCNNLTSLPELPTSLRELYCWDNQLTSLPELPNSLRTLWCYNNQLTSLPNIPNKLRTLNCGINQITLLPDMPNSLKILNCRINKLIAIPKLPNSLENLNYSYNQLISNYTYDYLNCICS